MNETDKVEMTIHIGGEHIRLSVAFDRQNAVRDAEKAAHDLYQDWRAKFPNRSDKEVLAMVAYQFASYYTGLLERFEKASATAADIDAKLSKIISTEKGR
ncbi:MAG: cell division protein ZapA [Muribaculaceae bacterium]